MRLPTWPSHLIPIVAVPLIRSGELSDVSLEQYANSVLTMPPTFVLDLRSLHFHNSVRILQAPLPHWEGRDQSVVDSFTVSDAPIAHLCIVGATLSTTQFLVPDQALPCRSLSIPNHPCTYALFVPPRVFRCTSATQAPGEDVNDVFGSWMEKMQHFIDASQRLVDVGARQPLLLKMQLDMACVVPSLEGAPADELRRENRRICKDVNSFSVKLSTQFRQDADSEVEVKNDPNRIVQCEVMPERQHKRTTMAVLVECSLDMIPALHVTLGVDHREVGRLITYRKQRPGLDAFDLHDAIMQSKSIPHATLQELYWADRSPPGAVTVGELLSSHRTRTDAACLELVLHNTSIRQLATAENFRYGGDEWVLDSPPIRAKIYVWCENAPQPYELLKVSCQGLLRRYGNIRPVTNSDPIMVLRCIDNSKKMHLDTLEEGYVCSERRAEADDIETLSSPLSFDKLVSDMCTSATYLSEGYRNCHAIAFQPVPIAFDPRDALDEREMFCDLRTECSRLKMGVTCELLLPGCAASIHTPPPSKKTSKVPAELLGRNLTGPRNQLLVKASGDNHPEPPLMTIRNLKNSIIHVEFVDGMRQSTVLNQQEALKGPQQSFGLSSTLANASGTGMSSPRSQQKQVAIAAPRTALESTAIRDEGLLCPVRIASGLVSMKSITDYRRPESIALERSYEFDGRYICEQDQLALRRDVYPFLGADCFSDFPPPQLRPYLADAVNRISWVGAGNVLAPLLLPLVRSTKTVTTLKDSRVDYRRPGYSGSSPLQYQGAGSVNAGGLGTANSLVPATYQDQPSVTLFLQGPIRFKYTLFDLMRQGGIKTYTAVDFGTRVNVRRSVRLYLDQLYSDGMDLCDAEGVPDYLPFVDYTVTYSKTGLATLDAHRSCVASNGWSAVDAALSTIEAMLSPLVGMPKLRQPSVLTLKTPTSRRGSTVPPGTVVGYYREVDIVQDCEEECEAVLDEDERERKKAPVYVQSQTQSSTVCIQAIRSLDGLRETLFGNSCEQPEGRLETSLEEAHAHCLTGPTKIRKGSRLEEAFNDIVKMRSNLVLKEGSAIVLDYARSTEDGSKELVFDADHKGPYRYRLALRAEIAAEEGHEVAPNHDQRNIPYESPLLQMLEAAVDALGTGGPPDLQNTSKVQTDIKPAGIRELRRQGPMHTGSQVPPFGVATIVVTQPVESSEISKLDAFFAKTAGAPIAFILVFVNMNVPPEFHKYPQVSVSSFRAGTNSPKGDCVLPTTPSETVPSIDTPILAESIGALESLVSSLAPTYMSYCWDNVPEPLLPTSCFYADLDGDEVRDEEEISAEEAKEQERLKTLERLNAEAAAVAVQAIVASPVISREAFPAKCVSVDDGPLWHEGTTHTHEPHYARASGTTHDSAHLFAPITPKRLKVRKNVPGLSCFDQLDTWQYANGDPTARRSGYLGAFEKFTKEFDSVGPLSTSGSGSKQERGVYVANVVADRKHEEHTLTREYHVLPPSSPYREYMKEGATNHETNVSNLTLTVMDVFMPPEEKRRHEEHAEAVHRLLGASSQEGRKDRLRSTALRISSGKRKNVESAATDELAFHLEKLMLLEASFLQRHLDDFQRLEDLWIVLDEDERKRYQTRMPEDELKAGGAGRRIKVQLDPKLSDIMAEVGDEHGKGLVKVVGGYHSRQSHLTCYQVKIENTATDGDIFTHNVRHHELTKAKRYTEVKSSATDTRKIPSVPLVKPKADNPRWSKRKTSSDDILYDPSGKVTLSCLDPEKLKRLRVLLRKEKVVVGGPVLPIEPRTK